MELEALESREPEKGVSPPARVLGFNFYLSVPCAMELIKFESD